MLVLPLSELGLQPLAWMGSYGNTGGTCGGSPRDILTDVADEGKVNLLFLGIFYNYTLSHSSMPGLVEKTEITFDGAPLSHLTAAEVSSLTNENGEVSEIVRGKLATCCLGILGAEDGMNHTHDLIKQYPEFRIQLEKSRQSVRLVIHKGPSNAFVEGKITARRKKHLAAAIRDMAYQAAHFKQATTGKGRSELVEKMTQDAGLLNGDATKRQRHRFDRLHQIVSQGGHTVGPADYKYSNRVGEEFGLRGFEMISGGGPGTMRGTLKGNKKGFNQQEFEGNRQMGFTCPEIIAAEPPNIYVTDLVIYPDIEKRLEAFARRMHGIVFLPGGVGTLEELLIQLGIKTHEANKGQYLPIAMTAAKDSLPYVNATNEFIGTVLGENMLKQYETIINAPAAVAEYMVREVPLVDLARDDNDDSDEWNRSMHMPEEFQVPFMPSHENVEALELHNNQPIGQLAAELRKLCKAIVHGSVTAAGMEQIREFGKFKIHGEPRILEALDKLLTLFIAQKRMRADKYEPCYELHVNG
jgi:pyrimidine/purine-5'-nucleotide nucleosidase